MTMSLYIDGSNAEWTRYFLESPLILPGAAGHLPASEPAVVQYFKDSTPYTILVPVYRVMQGGYYKFRGVVYVPQTAAYESWKRGGVCWLPHGVTGVSGTLNAFELRLP